MKILKEDEIKSPYDLREMLWYIIPGATLLLLIFFFEFWFATQIRGTKSFGMSDKNRLDSMQVLLNTADSLGKVNLVREIDSLTIIYDIHRSMLNDLHTPVYSALSMTHTPLFESVKGEKGLMDNWVLAALYLLLLFTICYILGHLTYIFGTFIYERGLISKGYSYPYLRLLDLEKVAAKQHFWSKSERELEASQAFYRGVFFWTGILYLLTFIFFKYFFDYKYYKYVILVSTVLIIFVGCRFKFVLANITRWTKMKKPKPQFPEREGILFWIICIIGVFLFFLIFFGFESSELKYSILLILFILSITELIIYFKLLPRTKRFTPLKNIKNQTEEDSTNREKYLKFVKRYYKVKFWLECFFIKGYHIVSKEIDKFSNNYFHTQKKFEPEFIEKYKDAFNKIYKSDYQKLTRHNYWLSKFYVMENSIYLTQQINFWENIYRFTKSLSAAFFMAFVYCSLSFMMQYSTISKIISGITDKYNYTNLIKEYNTAISILFLIPIIYYVIKILTVRYYIYVYDNRFNRMILRSFVSIAILSENNKNSSTHFVDKINPQTNLY